PTPSPASGAPSPTISGRVRQAPPPRTDSAGHVGAAMAGPGVAARVRAAAGIRAAGPDPVGIPHAGRDPVGIRAAASTRADAALEGAPATARPPAGSATPDEHARAPAPRALCRPARIWRRAAALGIPPGRLAARH